MKWQKYPKYKDSGSVWLGEVPAHWMGKQLKYFFRFVSGGTPSTAKPEYWDGDIPWVSAKDMKQVYLADTEDHISEQAVHESATSMVAADTALLVTRSGILRHTIPVAITMKPMAINQDIKGLPSIHGQVTARYFARYVQGNQSQLLSEWKKEGTTVESLETELISNHQFYSPPLEEQQHIVSFLDRESARIDTLIEKKKRQIELLQEKRIALISHAVTKGLDPNVEMKDSGVEWLGEVPEHWECKRFKFVLSEPLQYGANESAEYDDPTWPRYVRITDVTEDGTLRDETFKSLPEDVAKPYLLRDQDLLFARSGATVGKTFMYSSSWGRAAYAGYLIRARLRRAVVDPRFIAYFCRSRQYWDWLSSTFIQATIQNVSAERYANMEIALPALVDQQAIASFLDRETERITTFIEKVDVSINKLQEYRAALISAAVTGKIDVREEAA